jgi:hypothetical protein
MGFWNIFGGKDDVEDSSVAGIQTMERLDDLLQQVEKNLGRRGPDYSNYEEADLERESEAIDDVLEAAKRGAETDDKAVREALQRLQRQLRHIEEVKLGQGGSATPVKVLSTLRGIRTTLGKALSR